MPTGTRVLAGVNDIRSTTLAKTDIEAILKPVILDVVQTNEAKVWKMYHAGWTVRERGLVTNDKELRDHMQSLCLLALQDKDKGTNHEKSKQFETYKKLTYKVCRLIFSKFTAETVDKKREHKSFDAIYDEAYQASKPKKEDLVKQFKDELKKDVEDKVAGADEHMGSLMGNSKKKPSVQSSSKKRMSKLDGRPSNKSWEEEWKDEFIDILQGPKFRTFLDVLQEAVDNNYITLVQIGQVRDIVRER